VLVDLEGRLLDAEALVQEIFEGVALLMAVGVLFDEYVR